MLRPILEHAAISCPSERAQRTFLRRAEGYRQWFGNLACIDHHHPHTVFHDFGEPENSCNMQALRVASAPASPPLAPSTCFATSCFLRTAFAIGYCSNRPCPCGILGFLLHFPRCNQGQRAQPLNTLRRTASAKNLAPDVSKELTIQRCGCMICDQRC